MKPKPTTAPMVVFGPPNWYEHAGVTVGERNALEGIPVEFTSRYYGPESELSKAAEHWYKVVDQWFFKGLNLAALMLNEQALQEGVDPLNAINYLRCLMVSWAPKHEHKRAVLAWYMHQWYDPVDIEKLKVPEPEAK